MAFSFFFLTLFSPLWAKQQPDIEDAEVLRWLQIELWVMQY